IGNASTGDLALNDPNWSVTGAGAATFTSGTFNGNVDMTSDLILNIGDSGTDFTSGGGLTLAGAFLANGNVTLGNAITDNITFTGRVAQDSDLIPITATGTNDLGTSALPWDNLYANNIYAPSSGVSGYFQRNSGSLSPTNITDDLLLGATSTSSAKFGFINMAGGNPTATISGNLSLVVPTTAGANTFNLLNNSTLNFQRSPGGDAGLATALFIQNNGNVGIGTTSPSALLSVGSTSQFQVSSTGAITGVGVNSGSGLIQGTGGLTLTGATSINASGSNATDIGTGTNGGTITIGNASTGDLALNDPNWSVTGAGAATFTSGTFNGNVDMTSDLILNIG
ncbi:MAG: hypothetical protein Q7L55_11865, partial [Actinomycetota bacterium]|nr:hypothetical protein [Actinomycetota bacterium]